MRLCVLLKLSGCAQPAHSVGCVSNCSLVFKVFAVPFGGTLCVHLPEANLEPCGGLPDSLVLQSYAT